MWAFGLEFIVPFWCQGRFSFANTEAEREIFLRSEFFTFVGFILLQKIEFMRLTFLYAWGISYTTFGVGALFQLTARDIESE